MQASRLPLGWKELTVKRLVDPSKYYQIGDGDHGSIKPDMYQDEGIPYIRVQNLSWNGEVNLKGIARIPLDIHKKNMKSRLIPNDILIAKTGATVGKVGFLTNDIVEANTTSSVGKITVDQNRFSSRYVLYCLMSDDFQRQLWIDASMKSAQPGFNIDQLVTYKLLAPNLNSQQKIADFLDTETAKIDNLIAKQERLLQLLEEKRRATITHAVTRGLDPNVELKETNIPWLGKIPARWKVISLKYLLKAPVTDGPHETPTFTDSGVPFLSVDGIQDGELDLANVRYISESDHNLYSRKALVERGDILMGKAASTGKIAQVKTDVKFSIWSPLAILKFKPSVNVDFIEYVLKSGYIQYNIDILCTNNTQKNISMRDIPRLIIGLPEQSEQLEVVKHLQDVEIKSGALKQKIQTQITLLRERRTSLISHAVTGKIKV